MAIKVGKASEETAFKLYKGVAAFNIVAVNPNKKELEELQGRSIENEPEYKSKNDNGEDVIRITFYAKTNTEAKINNGIKLLIPISFIITKATKVGNNSGKVQVIDKYGRTAWATKNELESKTIPQYANGPANIDKDYRPIYQGEEHLINFLIQWLNIPNPADYKDGKWVMKSNPEDSEVSLNMDNLFKGDVSEIKNLISLAPNYLVKAAVGIRTTDEGKQYQNVFTRMFVKNAVTNYSKLDAAITEFQSNGGAANIEYSTEPLHENAVKSTEFKETTNVELPFDTEVSSPWD